MIVEADACVCKCGRPRCFSKLLTAPDTFWPIGLTYTGKCQKNDPSYMNVSNELLVNIVQNFCASTGISAAQSDWLIWQFTTS